MKIYKEEQFFLQEFPKRLRYALEKNDMTQNYLAVAIGTTDVSISAYICGKRIPKAPVIVAMAKVFGCTVEWLSCSEIWEEDVK